MFTPNSILLLAFARQRYEFVTGPDSARDNERQYTSTANIGKLAARDKAVLLLVRGIQEVPFISKISIFVNAELGRREAFFLLKLSKVLPFQLRRLQLI